MNLVLFQNARQQILARVVSGQIFVTTSASVCVAVQFVSCVTVVAGLWPANSPADTVAVTEVFLRWKCPTRSTFSQRKCEIRNEAPP
jgi:hypothetical protein